MPNLGEFLDSINYSKADLIRNSPEPQKAENEYSPFVINNCLSYHLDTAIFANEMNKSPGLSKKMQYDFLRLTISKKKRFSKWHKIKEDEEKLESIMEYFNYSKSKAKEASKILTDYQINIIKSKLYKGTIND